MEREVLTTAFGTCPVNLSDEDVLEAMKSIPGYLDITPGDFKAIYGYAYRHTIDRIAQSMQAKDVMTIKVISVTPDTSLKETATTMATHKISGIPVTDEKGAVVGIISENDFLSHMGEKKTRSTMDVIAQCLTSQGCVVVSMRKCLFFVSIYETTHSPFLCNRLQLRESQMPVDKYDIF